GSDAKVELKDKEMHIEASSEFQIQQIEDIVYNKLSKRSIDTRCLEKGKIEERGKRAYQTISVRQGIDKELAKKLVKLIKDSKIKVQAAVQGEQLRVTGKKRDDLQETIAMLKSSDIELPLQFTNFRD
ncbi:MAG: YajQ family cyclic di-GMP-binding protein, partial [Gammaproteobacteria bacterium]